MLMEFPKLIGEIRKLHPEPVEDISFLANIDRQNALRVKLIACGFAWKLSEDQLQDRLKKHGQERLYSRNLWEMILRYAFRHGYSYEKWRELHRTVMEYTCEKTEMEWEDVLSHTVEGRLGSDRALFRGGITIPAIEYYIEHNGGAVVQQTVALTEELELALRRAEEARGARTDAELLGEVVQENMDRFSIPRARARLYFLREVKRYMHWVIDQNLELFEQGQKERIPEKVGRYFGCRTDLKKQLPTLSREDLREYLMGKYLRPIALADDIVMFFRGPFFLEPEEYFQEALDSWYDDEEKELLVQRLNLREKAQIQGDRQVSAEQLLREYSVLLSAAKDLSSKPRPRENEKEGGPACKPGEKRKSVEKLAPEEKEQAIFSGYMDLLYLLRGAEKSEGDFKENPRNSSVNRRRYERCLREMLTGGMEISREWLLLMMLFVDKTTPSCDGKRLCMDRVNNVLQKCEFDSLDAEREFDEFIIAALQKDLTQEETENWLLNIAQMEFLEENARLTDTRIKTKTLHHQLSILDPDQAKQEEVRIERVAEKIKHNPWKREG